MSLAEAYKVWNEHSRPIRTLCQWIVLAFVALVVGVPVWAMAQEPQPPLTAPPATITSADAGRLTIGSAAPDISIEHWISDGKGKFPHTTELKDGQVYVVEFWATWCGPCVASMPELSRLQQEYADQGVQIISVTDETLDVASTLLDRQVPDGDGETYKELTSSYSLTADPDGSVYHDYFEAAGLEAIPNAFIVGKTGEIEWIGSPYELEEPLDQVVKGKWDREAFKVAYDKQREIEAKIMALQPALATLENQINQKIEAGEPEAAAKAVETAIASPEFEVVKTELEAALSEILILDVGGEKGLSEMQVFLKRNKDNAQELNHIAWMVYSYHIEEEVDKNMMAAATSASERAVKLEPDNPFYYDTLAHLRHASGKLDVAISLQTKAIELAEGSEKKQLQSFLEQLKTEKNNHQENTTTDAAKEQE